MFEEYFNGTSFFPDHVNNAGDRIDFQIDFENFLTDHLDLREMVVCMLLVDGFSLVEIAVHQGVSYRYIKTVFSNLKRKFKHFRSR